MHRSLIRFACYTAISYRQALAFQPPTTRQAFPKTSKLFTATKPVNDSFSTMTSSPISLPPVAATAKRLFLVRHGEVVNPGGDRAVYYGAMDVPLSPLGEEEAVSAAQYLSQFELAAVFSSNLSRAIYGAEQVCKLQKAVDHVVQLEGFMELDRGDWCGKTEKEIGSDVMARFDACDESVTPANGESYPALKRRVLQSRDEALRQIEPGQAGAIVSHLQVTRCMLSDALGIPIDQMTKLPVATASITCIDYDFASAVPRPPTVHFQSFKPDVGLRKSKDGAN